MSSIQPIRLAFLLLCLSTTHSDAQARIFTCVGKGGEKTFQDFPCGLAQNAAQQTEVERNRWTIQPRGACRVHSPLAPFIAILGEREFELQGGARLELIAAESGIAANVVLNAAWPLESAEPMRSEPGLASARMLEEVPVLQPQPALPSRTGAQLLELSGDISRHLIVTSTGQRFIVDSMLDPRRMAFGYGQTAVMLRTLRNAESFKFQLLLRAPEVSIVSGDLPAAGLRQALIALSSCVKQKQTPAR